MALRLSGLRCVFNGNDNAIGQRNWILFCTPDKAQPPSGKCGYFLLIISIWLNGFCIGLVFDEDFCSETFLFGHRVASNKSLF